MNVSDYLEDNAGDSIDVKDSKYVMNGFSVSPYPEYSLGLDIEDMSDEEFKNELKEYMKQHKDILSKENHILGLWKSPFDKKLYVDISSSAEMQKSAVLLVLIKTSRRILIFRHSRLSQLTQMQQAAKLVRQISSSAKNCCII